MRRAAGGAISRESIILTALLPERHYLDDHQSEMGPDEWSRPVNRAQRRFWVGFIKPAFRHLLKLLSLTADFLILNLSKDMYEMPKWVVELATNSDNLVI